VCSIVKKLYRKRAQGNNLKNIWILLEVCALNEMGMELGTSRSERVFCKSLVDVINGCTCAIRSPWLAVCVKGALDSERAR